ncbi:hypothetical protein GCM10011575_18540 [Microlunatus endophyticus]|uniref:Uncharacterized protein n=1 Tax=Microlunatus endophyticus TaxID=1716077 RepID=A0A917S6L2_9ACTN|nr:hypothetical protein [Microlunatus endophyticus]GGL60327.1 hypothetical protein GCM10011575_18540 [Microlunatus endophyticus]
MAVIATAGSGLLALVIAGLAGGWSDWRGVVSLTCGVAAIAAIVTTIRMPMVDDRRGNPLLGLDRRTKRRALRCIRHGDCEGAPIGVNLGHVAFFWGDAQVRGLRLLVPMVLLVLGNALTDGALWFWIFGVGFVVVAVVSVIRGIRDIRACRRFLISRVSGSAPRG